MEQQISITAYAQAIVDQLRQVVVGKDKVLVWVLAAILAKGHILLEDIPGVGKTTMALAFSRTLDLQYGRMQFTPDVLPSDVTGYRILHQQTGAMVYQKGAVLCNLFLADELNRATSRTQSALLEAMEEGQVTVDGITYPIEKPFTVIATQNPTGAAGTQLLPDSQLDRFMVRLSLGYPNPRDEIAMIEARQDLDPLIPLTPLVSKPVLLQMQELVQRTFVSRDIATYVVELIGQTRKHSSIRQGASPRATLSVIAMSKAIARLHGRDYVVPRDIQEVWIPTVAHRLLPAPGVSPKNMGSVLQELLRQIPAPRLG